jgi:predicted nucleic acid-binding protein
MLVPLCVQESKTARARLLYSQYEMVVWWAAPVEIASAIARLLRMKSIQPPDWTAALKIAAILSQAWSVIEPSQPLRARAEQLVQTYDLHAGDAFQLAAALQWCGNVPRGRTFLTADTRLFHAALLSGFDALSL